jgi:hypothetical protein
VADRIRLTRKSTAGAPALRRDLADRGVFYRVCGGIAGAPKHTPFARQKPTKRFLTGLIYNFY